MRGEESGARSEGKRVVREYAWREIGTNINILLTPDSWLLTPFF